MKQLLLIIIAMPLWATAQEVKPIVAAGYLALIHKDSIHGTSITLKDTTNSMRAANLHFTGSSPFYGHYTVKKISISSSNEIKFSPLVVKRLWVGGAASSTIEFQQANRQPALQKEYVQGRRGNWQGPETGEAFSYGPSIHTLSFDGTDYPYDIHGRLIASANPNARPYTNTIIRNGSLFTNAITLYARYKKEYTQLATLTFKAGQSHEQSVITTQNNRSGNFAILADATINKLTLHGSFNYRQHRYTHSNRFGLLNRAYQNSLLTPVSFENRQGIVIGSTQRSYSTIADNPFFLLDNDASAFLQQQQTGFLSIEQRIRTIKIKLNQSFEKLRQHSTEGYQPGSAFLPAGINYRRTAHDDNYSLLANALYTKPYNGHDIKTEIQLNYIFNSNRSVIDYSNTRNNYRYQRSAHDLALSFMPTYDHYNTESGLILTNKIYSSNTSSRSCFFLPAISGYTRIRNPFNSRSLQTKIFSSYNRSVSELPVDKSIATASQVLYSVANAGQYLPFTEATSFKNLLPVQHREFTAGIEINYKYVINFSASWFSRFTRDDVFPLVTANQLTLINMASHRNRGFEIELGNNAWIFKSRKYGFSNTLGFISYHNKVVAVKNGYNYAALAGFSDVHKALVNNQPLGVIVGNSWLRDEAGNIRIGADGFPLVNNNLSVIGNPNPDFIFKFNHHFIYKSSWELNIDWEWKKGGDLWNGTQALLDYYGRSATTAELRNTTRYIFPGVMADGTHNAIPVSFNDPALPAEQNRWIRYGHSGVAESYIQKASCIRIHNISIAFKPVMKKYLQQLSFSLFANNIILWSAAKGIDPEQLLNEQPGSAGLQFFNLPAVRSLGFTVSLQF